MKGTHNVGSVSTGAGKGAGVVVTAGAQRVVRARKTINERLNTVSVPSKAAGFLWKRERSGKEAAEVNQRGDGEGLHCA